MTMQAMMMVLIIMSAIAVGRINTDSLDVLQSDMDQAEASIKHIKNAANNYFIKNYPYATPDTFPAITIPLLKATLVPGSTSTYLHPNYSTTINGAPVTLLTDAAGIHLTASVPNQYAPGVAARSNGTVASVGVSNSQVNFDYAWASSPRDNHLYSLDGTRPLLANFAGGGFSINDVLDVNATGDVNSVNVNATGDVNSVNVNATGDVNSVNVNATGDANITGNVLSSTVTTSLSVLTPRVAYQKATTPLTGTPCLFAGETAGTTMVDSNEDLVICKSSGLWEKANGFSEMGGYQASFLDPLTNRPWDGSQKTEVMTFPIKVGWANCAQMASDYLTVAVRVQNGVFQSYLAWRIYYYVYFNYTTYYYTTLSSGWVNGMARIRHFVYPWLAIEAKLKSPSLIEITRNDFQNTGYQCVCNYRSGTCNIPVDFITKPTSFLHGS